MKKQLVNINNELSYINKSLNTLPEGRLCIKKNGNYEKWTYFLNGREIYIPKKNNDLAEKLAYRKYLEHQKQLLEAEKKAIILFQETIENQRIKENPLENKSYQHLLSKVFIPKSEELAAWAAEEYKTNESYRNYCIYKCISGDIVRSKSEMIIDQALFTNKIPFRYEAELIVAGESKYPDFTIRHPKTGEFFYWEHLGLMNKEKYKKKNIYKVFDYMREGIYPGKNLILTYESDDMIIDAEEVNNLIEFYFLNE